MSQDNQCEHRRQSAPEDKPAEAISYERPCGMTFDQAYRKAKKLWGERAAIDYNPLYELCCAVGVMSIPEPGDHARFILKGLARDWETCFLAAELEERQRRGVPNRTPEAT